MYYTNFQYSLQVNNIVQYEILRNNIDRLGAALEEHIRDCDLIFVRPLRRLSWKEQQMVARPFLFSG